MYQLRTSGNLNTLLQEPALELANDGDNDSNVTDIMICLAKTATGDANEGAGSVIGIYKLAAEVKKSTW